MENENYQVSSETGLAEQLNAVIEYEEGSPTQRFFNWLVDNLVVRFGLAYLTAPAIGYLLYSFFPEYLTELLYENRKFEIYLIEYMIGVVSYLVYYPICEKAFKGYTLGKLITGTRAIREDGTELSFKDAVLRTLVRVIPFEALSGFGYRPWHDTWTHTRVIKSR